MASSDVGHRQLYLSPMNSAVLYMPRDSASPVSRTSKFRTSGDLAGFPRAGGGVAVVGSVAVAMFRQI